MKKNKIVIITGNKYPEGDAGAIRQHSFSKIFQSLGYKPIVIGMGEYTNFVEKKYDGISYYSLRYKSNSIVSRVLGRFLFLYNLKGIIRKNRIEEIAGVLMVSGDVKTFRYVKKLKSYYGIPIYHDSVEWYSPEEYRNGKRNYEYKQKEKINTEIIDTHWKVVAISSYLEKHFISKGCKVIRIPVIMDINSIEPNLSENEDKRITFVYAGGPGRKDYLKEILTGFSLLSNEQKKRIKLHIVGVDEEQLIRVCGVQREILSKVRAFSKFHGRLSHNDATSYVRNADFSLLLRDENLRYAKAGFPTKIVESLSLGTPVLCNLSSDLELYLHDKENSIIINGHSPEAMKTAIEKTLLLDRTRLHSMRKNSRLTAEKYFDYKQYVDGLRELM